jgi:NAD(P)-dependent dehydrogenase (short-subunit alcohol dehydrogenase family)
VDDGRVANHPAARVTIVTGGGRGIGAATALWLAKAGHDVVVNYCNDEAAAAQTVALAAAQGVRALAVKADISDDHEVDLLFTVAARELGAITGLVNNAGVTAHIGDLVDTPVDIVRSVLDINLLGTILCARRAVQAMSVRTGGSGGAIVNVSSGAATLGSPHEYVHYAAAKAGVDAFTLGLAQEVAADGIRVNAVAPGTVRTGIHAAAGDPDRADRVGDLIPLGRPGEPPEIANAIGWLLSSEASYVTGAILRVAGGR